MYSTLLIDFMSSVPHNIRHSRAPGNRGNENCHSHIPGNKNTRPGMETLARNDTVKQSSRNATSTEPLAVQSLPSFSSLSFADLAVVACGGLSVQHVKAAHLQQWLSLNHFLSVQEVQRWRKLLEGLRVLVLSSCEERTSWSRDTASTVTNRSKRNSYRKHDQLHFCNTR